MEKSKGVLLGRQTVLVKNIAADHMFQFVELSPTLSIYKQESVGKGVRRIC